MNLREELIKISEEAAKEVEFKNREKIISEYLTQKLKEAATNGYGVKMAMIRVNVHVENTYTLLAADVAKFALDNNLQYKFRKSYPDEVYVSWATEID